MVLKKLPKPISKPLHPSSSSALTTPPPPPTAALIPPPEPSSSPLLPTISLSNTTTTQLTHFLKTHLKPSFTPQDLLSFLKNRLHHHPNFTQFDLHIFRYAATLDSFRHDHSTFEWMVRTLSVTDRFDALRSILEFMVLNQCPCSDGIFSCSRTEPIFRFAINSYCRVGRFDDALIAFDYMVKMIDGLPNVAVYNTLIHGFVKFREHEKALGFYNRMIKDRVKPDVFTFNILISSYCRNSEFGLAFEVFKEMRIKGCSPNVVSFNTLIKGFFRERKFEEGIGMAYEMIELGCEFSTVTCEILVGGLCRVGRVSEACNLVIDLSEKGVLPNGFDYFDLIAKLYKEVMGELWRKGNAPSFIACTTLIEGFRRVGKTEEAATLMEKMLKDGIVPDSATYNCLLRDVCNARKTVEANKLRLLASSKGLDPDGMTYNILVLGYTREVLIVYICLVYNSCAGVRKYIPNDDVCALCHSNVEGFRRQQNADNAVKAKRQGNYSEFLSILQFVN
ncbi:hypothetical protein ACSBR2_002679 [Camellia fascicularis]